MKSHYRWLVIALNAIFIGYPMLLAICLTLVLSGTSNIGYVLVNRFTVAIYASPLFHVGMVLNILIDIGLIGIVLKDPKVSKARKAGLALIALILVFVILGQMVYWPF